MPFADKCTSIIMRLVCISDTHTLHGRMAHSIPDGDVLIHAGDVCGSGTLRELEDFAAWFEAHPHPYKIVIAGNHDWPFQDFPEQARAAFKSAIYLEESGVEIDGVEFWGSPYQPRFLNWAFNLPRGNSLRKRWNKIPDGVDVLITHCPSKGVLDEVQERGGPLKVGCGELRQAIKRVQPRIHLFGHVHEGYGTQEIDGRIAINASVCTSEYRPTNAPIVVDM